MTSLHELFTIQQSEELKEIVYGFAPWGGEDEVVFIPKHWADLFVALQTSTTWGELSDRIGTEKAHLLNLYSARGYDEAEITQGLYPKPSANELFSFRELTNDFMDVPDPREASLVRAWLPEDLIVKYAAECHPKIPYGGGTWIEIAWSNTDLIVNELRARGYTCSEDWRAIREVYDYSL
jgi:hypothetical protein